jgi:hypothetical protein
MAAFMVMKEMKKVASKTLDGNLTALKHFSTLY